MSGYKYLRKVRNLPYVDAIKFWKEFPYETKQNWRRMARGEEEFGRIERNTVTFRENNTPNAILLNS